MEKVRYALSTFGAGRLPRDQVTTAKPISLDWDKLQSTICDFTWSNIVFKNEYRKGANFNRAAVLAVDIANYYKQAYCVYANVNEISTLNNMFCNNLSNHSL